MKSLFGILGSIGSVLLLPAALLGVFAIWWYSFPYIRSVYDYDIAKMGQFGDTFGAINALFSGLAFAFLIYTSNLQRIELSLQRQEMAKAREESKGQKVALEKQLETMRLQQFESSFFTVLEYKKAAINNIFLSQKEGFEALKHLVKIQAETEKVHGWNQEDALEYSSILRGQLNYLFNSIQMVFSFLESDQTIEKTKYVDLFRNSLSRDELILIYKHLPYIQEPKFEILKKKCEEYSLFRNTQETIIRSGELEKMWDKRAFEETQSGEPVSPIKRDKTAFGGFPSR